MRSLPLLLLFLAPLAAAQGPPQAGTWDITDNQTFHGQELVVRGNVTIHSGATLKLEASSLVFETTSPVEPVLWVQDGGTLQVTGADGTTSKILQRKLTPSASVDHFRYHIAVAAGGSLVGTDCSLQDVGTDTGNLHGASPPLPFGNPFMVWGKLELTRCTFINGQGTIARTYGVTRLVDLTVPPDQCDSAPNGNLDDLQVQGPLFIENSTFYSTLDVLSQSFHLQNLRIASVCGLTQGGFAISDFERHAMDYHRGMVDNVTVTGVLSCLYTADSTFTVSKSTFADCGEIRLNNAAVQIETSSLKHLLQTGSGGAVNLDDGSRLILQNVTIRDSVGNDFTLHNDPVAFLRNVTWSGTVQFLDGTGTIHIQGGVEIKVHDSEGNPVSGAAIQLSDGVSNHETRTDARGHALLWAEVDALTSNHKIADGGKTWTLAIGDQSFVLEALPTTQAMTVTLDGDHASTETSSHGTPTISLLAILFLLVGMTVGQSRSGRP